MAGSCANFWIRSVHARQFPDSTAAQSATSPRLATCHQRIRLQKHRELWLQQTRMSILVTKVLSMIIRKIIIATNFL